MEIDCNDEADARFGVMLRSVINPLVERVYAHNAGLPANNDGDGIYLGDSSGSDKAVRHLRAAVRNCILGNNSRHGLTLITGTSFQFTDNFIFRVTPWTGLTLS